MAQSKISGMRFRILVFVALSAASLQASVEYTLSAIPVCAGCVLGANDINDSGAIVGAFTDASGNFPGDLRIGGIDMLFNPVGSVATDANGLNNLGVIAGDYFTADGTDHPYIREPDGTFVTPPPPMPSDTAAFFGGVNDAGVFTVNSTTDPNQVFPYVPFLYNGTSYSPLTLPFSNVTSIVATGINDAGTVVGRYQNTTPGFGHGFERFADGTTVDLSFPGARQTFALGVNNSGEVVGGYLLNGVDHGFLYANGVWTTIDFVDANDDPNTKVEGINDLGQIVGVSFPTGNQFDTTSFVGTPVPEPGTSGLVALGLLATLFARWRPRVNALLRRRVSIERN